MRTARIVATTARRRNRSALCGMILLLGVPVLAAGCVRTRYFRGIDPAARTTLVLGVPPVLQSAERDCGLACIQALCRYWLPDFEKRVEARSARLVAPATAEDLANYAISLDLRAFAFQATFERLHEDLARGRPAIVMLSPLRDPDIAKYGPLADGLVTLVRDLDTTANHWVVVIGTTASTVILFDPAIGTLEVEAEHFRASWARKGYACVLVGSAADDPRPQAE
jgi:predicted double-glycine peptidase